MSGSPSKEREEYHNQLRQLTANPRLARERLIYDIGRTSAYPYRDWFPAHEYKVIDIDPEKKPDICIDVETGKIPNYDGPGVIFPQCDVLLCNGVTEQCSNPFQLVVGCRRMLEDKDSIALFGIIGPGYPEMQGLDRVRFTEQGVRHLLEKHFVIEQLTPVRRDGIANATYHYALCSPKG